jgi:hypothetical protein
MEYIGRENLDYYIGRLRKRGLSQKRAERAVYSFFNAAMSTLDGGKVALIPGSDDLYFKKSGEGLEIFSRP